MGEKEMKKKIIFSLFLLWVLLFAGGFQQPSATEPTKIDNINEMRVAGVVFPETVDPHWAYDMVSLELIGNVYDTLLFLDWEEVDEFRSRLATEWSTENTTNGPDTLVIFKIRTDVQFHSGRKTPLKPEDVEYSFERWMFMDRTGGPTWLIYQPLLGVYGYDGITDPDVWAAMVDTAVESNTTHVWFNLIEPYPLNDFYRVLAMPWSGILDKTWAIANGAWNGVNEDWINYYDPTLSPFDHPEHIMAGTGPYKLDYINFTTEKWSITKFDECWGGWPAYANAPDLFPEAQASDWVDRATYMFIPVWEDRREMFLSGKVDMIQFETSWYWNELEPYVLEGKVRYIKVPIGLALGAMFLNFNISSDSPYIGTGNWTTGIPLDFFDDYDARYGFAYSFNWTKYLELIPEATQPATPLVKGVGFDDLYEEENEDLKYYCDPVLGERHLKLAHGGVELPNGRIKPGELWKLGFTFTIPYGEGIIGGPQAAYIIEMNIEAYNELRLGLPPFEIHVIEMTYSEFLAEMIDRKLPLFNYGESAYTADDLFFEFFHSEGFTVLQSYASPDNNGNGTPDADELIEQAMEETDPNVRKEIFRELMYLWRDEIPSLPMHQALTRHYERTWVQGWYYNPVYMGGSFNTGGLYFYHLWKGLDGDLNCDGIVDVFDLYLIGVHWYPSSAVVTPSYNRLADISDKTTGAYPPQWGLMYPYDGKVDISDLEYLSAYFGDTADP